MCKLYWLQAPQATRLAVPHGGQACHLVSPSGWPCSCTAYTMMAILSSKRPQLPHNYRPLSLVGSIVRNCPPIRHVVSCCVCGTGGSGWPSNTLLYVGASASSTISRNDPLVSRCPLVVALPGIDTQEQYAQVGFLIFFWGIQSLCKWRGRQTTMCVQVGELHCNCVCGGGGQQGSMADQL